MKKKKIILGTIILLAVMAINLNHRKADETFQLNLSHLISMKIASAEDSSGCSASANCFKTIDGQTVVSGSVSCTGDYICLSGDGWVNCDNNKSACI
ncbi:hypothetical protein [Polaribacter cellanae]|uniref:Uncharacterized protein n=1 Tax=Polaribacter cellanae TaxID=2818493 RepID=A0A975CT44_9FLAO|nr:hypothetical protein [Polaribacter cellanae]QTE23547.1 hypothetical protein J3359_04490 [Polaribacter cellanae]